jgi:hypothetical protein
MADDIIDLLQIKIEKAKSNLSDDTLNAIAAVPWRDTIIQMRERDGFTFEQLGSLELETELLLCGLLSPVDYPKELEKRMGISKAAANSLTEEMNKLVFEKIKEELIKITERKKIFAKKNSLPLLSEEGAGLPTQAGGGDSKEDHTEIFKTHGIEIIPEKLEISTPAKATQEEGNNTIHPMLAQKMSMPVQAPVVKTEHTLNNLTPATQPNITPKTDKPKIDPYREIPE